jgi:hypothetical protein
MLSGWLANGVAPLLGGVAEGAWIAVFAAAAGAPLGGVGLAGSLSGMVAAALLGVAAGRWLPLAWWRPAALFGIAVTAAVGGLVLERSGGGAPSTQLQPVLVGPLLGLAVLRGAVHGDPSAEESAIEGLVQRSPWLLGIGWAAGLTMAAGGRQLFIAAAYEATLVFVVAATLAMGAARLHVQGAASPGNADAPRGNQAWLLLGFIVVGGAALVALPVAALLGVQASGVLQLTAGLLTVVVLGSVGALVTIMLVVIDTLASLLRSVIQLPTPQPAKPPPAGPQLPPVPGGGTSSGDPIDLAISLVIFAAVVLLAVWLSIRWQGARARRGTPDRVAEERAIDIAAGLRLPRVGRPSRPRRWRAPHSALEAYPRLLEGWADGDPRARDAAETPIAHGARLRENGRPDLGLELLAADYQLVRFAGHTLSSTEEARAVARWRRLRGAPPPAAPPAVVVADTATPGPQGPGVG